MTREEIIALALKHTVGGLEFDDGGLLAFFNEAYVAGASAEREECAKVLDEMAVEAEQDMEPSGVIAYYRSKAAAIRARKNQ